VIAQRWNNGRDTYRPAGEPINTRRFEVASIERDKIARGFVEQHHYSASYPAARFRYGIYRAGGELAGVAVFSHPSNNAELTNIFPGPVLAGVVLGRLVLLDDVPANGESWMIARCFDLLRREGIEGVLSCSDPMPRPRADGGIVFAGHVGTIYQATNGIYAGRTRARRRLILPDATELNDRLIAKVRAAARGDAEKSRGWSAAVQVLARFGAPAVEAFDGIGAWLDYCIAAHTRPLQHRGNHRYVWGLSRSMRRALPTPTAFPKQTDSCVTT
jgi:hypothetical protein